VLVLARARDALGNSLLYTRNTTSLRKWQESSAWFLTAWKLGNYYRTYKQWVEDEVRENLLEPDRQYQHGPLSLLKRGTEFDDKWAFVTRDRNYVSARWPGDAFLLARTLMDLLQKS